MKVCIFQSYLLSNVIRSGMEHFLKEISFHGVMLDNLFYADYIWQKELNLLLADHIKKGAVKPLVRTVFSADEVEAAFR